MTAGLEHLRDVFTEVPLTVTIAGTMRQVSRDDIPDMPDRIIAATALSLKVPVLSRDRRIRAAALHTIW